MLLTQAAHLKLQYAQLVILLKESKQEIQQPIDQIAYVILDHPQITLTQQLVAHLTAHNVATVFCDARHHPHGMVLPLDGHHIQTKRFRTQWAAKASLKKQLWKKTIQAKIRSQANLLTYIGAEEASKQLTQMIAKVRSGDNTHIEAHAARLYWPHLFGEDFVRERKGAPPNHLLNYGYAILRAATARALVGHGLLPACSIQHHNRYNAYPLADDMMEPYRPFVDQAVRELYQDNTPCRSTITNPDKARLLATLQAKCIWQTKQTTLAAALERSSEQFCHAFEQGTSALTLFSTFPAKQHKRALP